MLLQKTTKTVLSSEDILKYISDYEAKTVPHLTDLWEYYKGKNVKILARKPPDQNNPDNKIVVSYARKLITTWTGYGARPKYITYKANIKKTSEEIEEDENIVEVKLEEPTEKIYTNEIQNIYNANNETIKTNRAWRNIGIFGMAYELLYIDSDTDITDTEMPNKVMPKFITVDPREMIVLYDYSPEPKIVCGIRYYKLEDDTYKVEVYYNDHTETYIRKRKDQLSKDWVLVRDQPNTINPYKKVPIITYYLGNEMQSIFENILSLIDAYDVLFSDSMNEFDRFAFAYLIMKKFGLTSPTDKKDPVKSADTIKQVKRRRVFEHLDKDADIRFLTKDIPTAFIEYMGKQLREQIHLQSHIPDFTLLTGALSGAAIDRLLFDFENLVSSAEADFDTGLIKRGEMITDLMISLKRMPNDYDFSTMINIQHKRNLPLDRNSFAQLSLTLSSAGYSRRMIVSQMPEDMVPDVEQELREEKKEQLAMIGSENLFNEGMPIEDEENIEEKEETT